MKFPQNEVFESEILNFLITKKLEKLFSHEDEKKEIENLDSLGGLETKQSIYLREATC